MGRKRTPSRKLSLVPQSVVLVSSEVVEEVHEIMDLLDQCEDVAHIFVTVPHHVAEALDLRGDDTYTLLVSQYAEFGNVRAKLFGLVRFLTNALQIRPDVIISGYPMFKHRLTAWLLRRSHISYLRGLMFDADQRSGFSDKLQTSRLARVLPRRLKGSFEADALLTVSSISEEFLRARNVPEEKIHLVGPVWLAKLTQSSDGDRPGESLVTVCTSALAAHGYTEKHELQVDALAAAAESSAVGFRIRPHPRDFYDYESDARFADVEFDRTPTSEFLKRVGPGDLIVSQQSTLAFEAAYFGAGVAFYTLDSASDAALARRGFESHPLTPEYLENPILADASDVFSTVDLNVLPKILASVRPSGAP